MKDRYLILDCYVDEPACLGVPPFISHYPRYLYGALLDAGVTEERIDYLTIDSVRESGFRVGQGYSMAFLIGGAAVPGKYLGYRIGTLAEIHRVIAANPRLGFAVGGWISRIVDCASLKNARAVGGDIEKFAFTTATGVPLDTTRTYGEISRWAVHGAGIVKRHPEYPHLIAEIETYRGCPRTSHCSFCVESLRRGTEFRREDDILAEIDALASLGVRRFRIGCQPDILLYGSTLDKRIDGFPQPSPGKVISLFRKLLERRRSGSIDLLNIDNANPGTIARFPDESAAIIAEIAGAVTPGDTMSLGVESLDPAVITRNNLKVDGDQLFNVVKLINDIGASRDSGVPRLLPGINLIHGLPGETDRTFKINYEALKKIADAGMMLRRINIRKMQPFPGTGAASGPQHAGARVKNRYEYYKEKIRAEIDRVMLERVYPGGAVLNDFRVEEARFDYSLAKQLASYGITAVIPMPLPAKSFLNVIVTGYRERSLSALPVGFDINTLPAKAIETIPGVGRKTAEAIVLGRPFADAAALREVTGETAADFFRAARARFGPL